MSLKIYDSLITFLMILEVIGRLVLSKVYERPKIFEYDLNLERQGLLI